MRLFKTAAFLAVCFFSIGAFCADDGWYVVAKSQDGNDEYSIKFGSGNLSQNKDGEPIEVLVGKIAHKKENNTDFYKWYVTESDCTNEYGNVVVLGMDGNFKFNAPFAKGSKTIGSAIADLICEVGTFAKKKQDEGKGI